MLRSILNQTSKLSLQSSSTIRKILSAKLTTQPVKIVVSNRNALSPSLYTLEAEHFPFSIPFSKETINPGVMAGFDKIDVGTEILGNPYQTNSLPPISKQFSLSYRGSLSQLQKKLMEDDIKQLQEKESVLIYKGDPRDLSTLLVEGISPKNPHGHADILKHRKSSDGSRCVSFSFSFKMAAFFGAKSSMANSYGPYKILGNGFFNVLVAKVNGSDYDVAGPGKFMAQEQEATVVGAVKPETIFGWRACRMFNSSSSYPCGPFNQIACGPLFIKKALSESEKEQCRNMLGI